MSVEDSVSEAIGSAGTGTGSRTGSGGPGGRDPLVEPVGGGGLVGRATGGFFFPHAPEIISATIITATTVRFCFIVSLILVLSAFLSALSLVPFAFCLVASARQRRAAYCDQLGYLFIPALVTCLRFLPSRSIRKICSLPARVDVKAR